MAKGKLQNSSYINEINDKRDKILKYLKCSQKNSLLNSQN